MSDDDDHGHSRARRSKPGTELVVTRDGKIVQVDRRPAPLLAVDAATRPLNVLVLGGMGALALLTGLPFSVALVVYGLCVAASFVELRTRRIIPGTAKMREAIRRLPVDLQTTVAGVLDTADRIRTELDRHADDEPEGVREGVDQLSNTLVETASRAADVDRYLQGVSRDEVHERARRAREAAADDPSCAPTAEALEEQLGVIDGLAKRRVALDRQIDQIGATLGVIQARLVQARIETAGPLEVGHELVELRDRTRALAESLAEVNELGSLSALAEHKVPAE